jgi:dynein heavy chain, axonemal
MSPFGDGFRNRLRMFPSLVNCATIDWFNEWPEEALQSVAVGVLSAQASHTDAGEPRRSGIRSHRSSSEDITTVAMDLGTSLLPVVAFLKYAHTSVAAASNDYARSLRRHNYVTATSYLEALATFQSTYKSSRSKLNLLKSRLNNGLFKLKLAFSQVGQLQVCIRVFPVSLVLVSYVDG